jgi:hypothetical protein
MSYCPNCGAALSPGSAFCSRCGTAVTQPPPPAHAPQRPPLPPPRSAPPATQPHPSRRSLWWIVPLAIIAIVLIGWLVLKNLPFGEESGNRQDVETVEEGPPPETATIVEMPAETPAETEVSVDAERPGIPEPADEPSRDPERQGDPEPPPASRETASSVTTRPGEISPSEATRTLQSYVIRQNYYRVDGDCIRVRNLGYRNVGYTLEVSDRCADGKLLGRWRVDSKTREVFRQAANGRYLRP